MRLKNLKKTQAGNYEGHSPSSSLRLTMRGAIYASTPSYAFMV
jgi:hypothetical protein